MQRQHSKPLQRVLMAPWAAVGSHAQCGMSAKSHLCKRLLSPLHGERRLSAGCCGGYTSRRVAGAAGLTSDSAANLSLI